MELEEGGMERGEKGGFLGVGKKGIVGNQAFLGLRKAYNIYRSLFEHRVEKQNADTLHKHDRSHALGIREKPGPVQSRTSRAADSLGQRVSVNKVVKERAYFEW